MERRTFAKSIAVGLGAATLPGIVSAQTTCRPVHKIGHTGITWVGADGGKGVVAKPAAAGGKGPAGTGAGWPPLNPTETQTTINDVGSLGYWGLELFGSTVEDLESYGGVGQWLDPHQLQLISIVASPNILDSDKLKESIQVMIRQGKVAKKYGVRIVLMNAAGVMRDKNYTFSEHKTQIANALNDAAKAMADIGLQAVLHQHTQTMVETRDEVYAIMDAVDTKYVKAGFDVGQLKKGGSDPVEIIKNFLPVIEHMHLKDYDGKEHWLGYAPFGQGTNDLKTILALMESKGPIQGMIMVELDPDAHPPIPPMETAKIAKKYLQNLGYSFRS